MGTTTATDTEVGTEPEKVNHANAPAHRVSFDEEAQASSARRGIWSRVSNSIQHGLQSASAAMAWAPGSVQSTTVSSGSGTSYTSYSYGYGERPRLKERSSTAGTGTRLGSTFRFGAFGDEDTRDRTPVSLVVGASGERASNEADRVSVVDDDPQPVASRYHTLGNSGHRVGSGAWAWNLTKYLVTRKLWPTFKDYCDSSFPDKRQEENFQRESWFAEKTPALLCSVFFLVEYALILGLMTPANDFCTYWGYVVVVGVFTLPLPLMILFNGPQRFNWIYQFFVLGAGWSFGYMVSIEMYHCHHGPDMSMCMTRATTFIMGPLFALPTLTLLAMRQNRMLNLLLAVAWVIFASLTIMYLPGSALASTRTVFDFTLYHIFLTYLHYTRERSERQTFLLRQELKNQCKAAQSAQEMERRANQSKKRFVSYIFHEVRVPLNTALLAVQNLEGEGVFRNMSEDHTDMIYGLMGSLNVMEKVLNDVLSFNRMDSGKFTLESNPLDLHKSLQVVAMSHRAQAERSGVGFSLQLDPRIDALPGTLMGDDMRLRQVVSNLLSNALKFTETGSVTIITKLVLPRTIDYVDESFTESILVRAPHPPGGKASRVLSDPETGKERDTEKALPATAVNPGTGAPTPPPRLTPAVGPNTVVIRVEVHDTGVGLSTDDLTGNRLFSPYVQTEIGRRQGGKGSGLGLALVRQIVTLSKGRLGVKSQVGKGSIFWFEIPYTLVPPEDGELTPPATPSLSAILDRGGLTSPSVVTLTLPVEKSERPDKDKSRPASGVPEVGAQTSQSQSQGIPPGKAGTLAIQPHVAAASDPFVEPSPMSTHTLYTPGSEESDKPLLTPSSVSGIPASGSKPQVETESGLEAEATPAPTPSELVPTLSPAPTKKPSNSELKPSLAAGKPLNALVVDDDPLTRKLMSRMLKRLGHSVVGTAENGQLALDLIRGSFEARAGSQRIDIVFLDNQMPVMSGVEVTQELRRIGCRVFIVGCTGNALLEDQDEYLSAGADGLITKPISQVKVLAMLELARGRVDEVEQQQRPQEDVGVERS